MSRVEAIECPDCGGWGETILYDDDDLILDTVVCLGCNGLGTVPVE